MSRQRQRKLGPITDFPPAIQQKQQDLEDELPTLKARVLQELIAVEGRVYKMLDDHTQNMLKPDTIKKVVKKIEPTLVDAPDNVKKTYVKDLYRSPLVPPKYPEGFNADRSPKITVNPKLAEMYNVKLNSIATVGMSYGDSLNYLIDAAYCKKLLNNYLLKALRHFAGMDLSGVNVRDNEIRPLSNLKDYVEEYLRKRNQVGLHSINIDDDQEGGDVLEDIQKELQNLSKAVSSLNKRVQQLEVADRKRHV